MKARGRDAGARDPAVLVFDVVSYGRRGPTPPRVFSHEQLEQLSRTARGVPEVMVKVTGGGRDGHGVAAHFEYIGRNGVLEIETDDGRTLTGESLGKVLVQDWDLDLYPTRLPRGLTKNQIRRTAKLVHNITLSMPATTDARKVLAAARAFASENFALKHRYALVLHTDTPHPHVHLCVKAESEEAERLYIRKATLRQWRADFARHLGEQGIVANATPRAVRGRAERRKSDGIYRADQRGESTHMRERFRSVARNLREGKPLADSGKAMLEETRRQVVADWKRSLGVVVAQGETDLAIKIAQFIKGMPSVQTEREAITELISAKVDKREMQGPER